MKTLDRYIVRNFLSAAILWFLILISLRVVIDMFVNMDEFAKAASMQKETFLQLIGDIVNYYGYQSIAYVTELGGVIIVSAATFSLARMNHTNELTAMMASGVSLRRVVAPIVACSMAMGALIFVNQEYAIPNLADKLVRSHDEVPAARSREVLALPDGGGALWYAGKFRPNEWRMDWPMITIRDQQAVGLAAVRGKEAWPAQLDGRDGWMLSEATISPATRDSSKPWVAAPNWREVWTQVSPDSLYRLAVREEEKAGRSVPANACLISNVDALDEDYGMRLTAREMRFGQPADGGAVTSGELIQPRFAFRLGGRQLGTIIAERAVWTPGRGADSRWELTGGRAFFASDLTAEDVRLRQSSSWLDYMSIADLTRLIAMDQVSDRKAAELAKNIRVAEPVNNLVLLLLGLPFILSRERNIRASAGLCLLMVGTFYAFIYICRYMGLPPAWGAWLPILLFGPIAVAMLDSVKT